MNTKDWVAALVSRFELGNTPDGRIHFSLKAGNGEIILTGETYDSKQNALEAIAAVRASAPLEQCYERKIAANSQPHFRLKAANGQALGQSALFPDFGAMENAIASVARDAAHAAFTDLTED